MKASWVCACSGDYDPLMRVMIANLQSLTVHPIVCYGWGWEPKVDGCVGRQLNEEPMNLGFRRMQAVVDAMLQDDLDVAIYTDSDMLFGKPVDWMFDLPECEHPLLPEHPWYDFRRGLDKPSVEQCLLHYAKWTNDATFKQTTCYLQSNLHVVYRAAIPAIQAICVLGRELYSVPETKLWTEEPAWNAWIWAHGSDRHIPFRVRRWTDFWRDASRKVRFQVWHGERDHKEAEKRLKVIQAWPK